VIPADGRTGGKLMTTHGGVSMVSREEDEAYQGFLDTARQNYLQRAEAETEVHFAVEESPRPVLAMNVGFGGGQGRTDEELMVSSMRWCSAIGVAVLAMVALTFAWAFVQALIGIFDAVMWICGLR
jgi:hypothetical protein